MSFTLLYRSKKTRFVYNFNLRQLVSVSVLLSAVLLMSSRDSLPLNENLARIEQNQTGLIDQQNQVNSLKQQTEQQLTGMLLKLSDMQAQMQRINALGARLVEQSGIGVDEFNFSQEPPIGGPAAPFNLEFASSDMILSQMDVMLHQLADKQQQLAALESILLNHHVNDEMQLAGRPIKSGWLSSYYGIRKDPFSGLPAMHKGIDFAGKEGAEVIATGAGVVTWSGDRYGYGQLVEIDHGNGLVTRYGHNKELNVKLGDIVTKGQKIASMGSTGRSTGAHVHYEVIRHGKQQDPLPFIAQ